MSKKFENSGIWWKKNWTINEVNKEAEWFQKRTKEEKDFNLFIKDVTDYLQLI